MSKPKKPSNLEDAGSALWSSIVGKYELRPDEVVMLTSACMATDRIAAMEDERAGAVTERGSMGQLVVHPLIGEIRAHEAQVAGILAKLKLPDDAAGGEANQARSAANSRWAAAHGAGA